MAEGEQIMARAKKQSNRKATSGYAERQKLSSRLHLTSLSSEEEKHSPHTVLATAFGAFLVIVLISGFALLVMVEHPRASSASTSQGASHAATVYNGYGSLNHVKGPCGNNAQQPACPTPQPNWIAIPSESPASVAQAMEQSIDFRSLQNHFGFTSLDTPVLVHAFDAHTGISYYDDDHWVVSVRNASGMRCGILDFVYDRANQRMRFSSYGVITSADPRHTSAFPYVSEVTAMQSLRSQKGLQIRTGTQPELIFFPINPAFPILTSPVSKWMGGGNSPMLPIWQLVGTNGQDYFVGTDLNVYTQQALPVATGRP
jgi:hypothetical protein